MSPAVPTAAGVPAMIPSAATQTAQLVQSSAASLNVTDRMNAVAAAGYTAAAAAPQQAAYTNFAATQHQSQQYSANQLAAATGAIRTIW